MKTVTKEEFEKVASKYIGKFYTENIKQEIINELFPHEFKVGDWVVGWHVDVSDYKTKAWLIEKIKKEYVFRDNGHNTFIEDIRHATPEEIEAAQWEANKPYKVWLHGEMVMISADEVGHFYRHGGFSGATAKYTKYEKL